MQNCSLAHGLCCSISLKSDCILSTSKFVCVILQSANIEANVSILNDKTHNSESINTVHVTNHELGTHTLASCLENPPEATITVKSAKATILEADFDASLSASINHPSAKHIATVANETSWCHLWDTALEHGVRGTRRLQLLLKELSRRPFDGFSCRSCGRNLNDNPSWFHHICNHHPEAVDNLSCEEIISALKEENIYVLSTAANSKLSTIFSGT